jgi:hypothetical protein
MIFFINSKIQLFNLAEFIQFWKEVIKFCKSSYLQQSFLLTKIAFKIFKKNCPIDFTTVIVTLLIALPHSSRSSEHLQK